MKRRLHFIENYAISKKAINFALNDKHKMFSWLKNVMQLLLQMLRQQSLF